ncbi:hypothetical protein ILYODFUR_029006, partial [Ilyodon furcidens]
GRGRWPLTLNLVLLEVSSCYRGFFLFTVATCMLSMRDCCKVKGTMQATVHCCYISTRRSECC